MMYRIRETRTPAYNNSSFEPSGYESEYWPEWSVVGYEWFPVSYGQYRPTPEQAARGEVGQQYVMRYPNHQDASVQCEKHMMAHRPPSYSEIDLQRCVW